MEKALFHYRCPSRFVGAEFWTGEGRMLLLKLEQCNGRKRNESDILGKYLLIESTIMIEARVVELSIDRVHERRRPQYTLIIIRAAYSEILLTSNPAANFPNERNDHEERIRRNADLFFASQIPGEQRRGEGGRGE